ncbi:MAG TPA: Nif3-like dinuclear metal center hexameric protein [Phycisphaerae bacterium]|nr:Nif3-like dinuclear metal center hexameric protein [Phycisphaerae bacterium]
MSKRDRGQRGVLLSEVCRALERIAPAALAEEWDNVGLLAGDAGAPVRRVLVCIDLTSAVVDEAVGAGVELIMAYHPPIFRPISRLHGHGTGTDAHVFRCVAGGIAVYSVHTALDAADGGTNDVLAGLCGVKKTQPIEYAEAGPQQCKVVVFVPAESADKVASAMFDAGAGHIGDYDMCSYRLSGEGTFRGSECTSPTIGEAGRFERVAELRIESIVLRSAVPGVIEAIRKSHPYEEPAFDVYPLVPEPTRGSGRYGDLPRPTTLGALARKLKKATAAECAQIVGDREQGVTRAVVCVGAAGSLPFRMRDAAGQGLAATDVIVTGEIRHHDALTIRRHGCGAIALGHWASEHPALKPFADRLAAMLATLDVRVSTADEDPFTQV